MSKRFKKSFDKYEIGRWRFSTIELDRTGLARYRELGENALYYANCLQYLGSGFYRAAIGYELLWDRRVEDQLNLCLDYFLTDLRDKELYYFEELKVTRDARMHGVTWPRGIGPQTLRFDLQWPFEVKVGMRITARVNLVDKPNRVDLELADGRVFTISYIRYWQARDSGLLTTKGTRHATTDKPKAKQPRSSARESSVGTRKDVRLKLVEGFKSCEPPRLASSKLSHLR